MTTSNPGATRYMAPELLHPTQFGLTYSNPSKESDVYSFAMTAYEVFPSHLVARVINERLLPMTSSSRGTCRIVESRRVSRPFVSYLASGHLARLTQSQATGYPTKSGTPFGAAGTRLRILDLPFIYCVKNSLNWDKTKRGPPQSPRMGNLIVTSRDSLANSF